VIGEDAGRHTNWILRRSVPNSYLLNAAWADYNTKVRVHGYDFRGLVREGGCCVMNCNNNDEIYSFHPGGSNVLRGDGSVVFLEETIAPGLLAALITKSGAEVVDEGD
jgi:prepilin-type processing-associated H-X9-DG protein